MKKLLIVFLLLWASAAFAQTTPNYGFNVPPFNTQNWGTLENQNWYQLDSLLSSGGVALPTPSSSGLCFVSTGNSPGDWGWATCPGGGGGFTNPMTTLGDLIQGGSAGTPTRYAGITTYPGVPQIPTQVSSGGVAGSWGTHPGGVIPRPSVCGSNVDTILATDRVGYVSESDGSTCTVTLPQAGSTNFDANMVFATCAIGAGNVVITPTTSTISYSTGSAYVSAASTMTLSTGQCAFIYSDNTNYFAIKQGASGGGGGTSSSLENCTSDQTGNSSWVPVSLTNWFAGHWEFVTNNASYFNCSVYVPVAQAGATIVLDIFDNDATAGHTAQFQTCDNIITSGTLQVGALTCAAAQTFTTTSTAYQRVSLTFNVQSSLANNGILVVKIATLTSGSAPAGNLIVMPHFIL